MYNSSTPGLSKKFLKVIAGLKVSKYCIAAFAACLIYFYYSNIQHSPLLNTNVIDALINQFLRQARRYYCLLLSSFLYICFLQKNVWLIWHTIPTRDKTLLSDVSTNLVSARWLSRRSHTCVIMMRHTSAPVCLKIHSRSSWIAPKCCYDASNKLFSNSISGQSKLF